MIDLNAVKAAIDPAEMRRQATRVLIDNQECYVAQWIIQNPFENIQDYKLSFRYYDENHPEHGYHVRMIKIGEENV